eukprot:NODE_437_length_8620_cov_0.295857.p4 type:complete len:188 gc:universal NODE_437_length_8620_cov_0.295857:3449-4012(+)
MFVDPSNTLLPEELHTIAKDSIVRCIPNADIEEHYTLFRKYGPFKSNVPCEMPLFMALQLKVNIEISLYYTNQDLDKLLKLEKSKDELNLLPHKHFFEIGFILDHNIKKLNDLRNMRFDKMMRLIKKMHPNLIQMGSPTSYEINLIRPLIMPLMAYLHYANPGNVEDLTAANVKKKYNDIVSKIQEE